MGSNYIKELNKQYRHKDKSTDVLSFPQENFSPPLQVHDQHTHDSKPRFAPISLGDLIISIDDARKNAIEIGQPLERELAFLIIHGILHLVGHDHLEPDEERKMLDQQNTLINLAGKDSPALWKGIIQNHGD